MIRLVCSSDAPWLRDLLGTAPFFAAEMEASWTMREHLFRVGDEAVLLLRGGFALLYGRVQDTEEMESFLHFQKVLCVQSSGWVPNGFQAREQWVLKHWPQNVPALEKPSGYDLEREPVLYRAARACITPDVTDTPPDEWAARACVRRNRCGGQMLALKKGEEYAALAGIFASTSEQAYLAGVVTAGAHRGKGCASYLVDCLAREQERAGKAVFLVCENDKTAFYGRLGFEKEMRIVESRKTE